MKKYHIITAALLLALFASCNNVIYEENHPIPDSNWQRFEAEEFNFSIKNPKDCYHVVASVRIDTTIVRIKDIPLVVNVSSDNGENRMFYSHLPLVDKKGVRRGSCAGQYQTAEFRIREYFFFNNAANYTLTIKQGTECQDMPGVNSVGLRVEKADLDQK